MDYDKLALSQSGIYAIVNLRTERQYVGQTGATFRRRWTLHLGELERGTHPCSPLQWDWVFWGADSFEFRILEVIEHRYSDYILHREAVYISRLKNPYNVHMPAARRLDIADLTRVRYTFYDRPFRIPLPPNAILQYTPDQD